MQDIFSIIAGCMSDWPITAKQWCRRADNTQRIYALNDSYIIRRDLDANAPGDTDWNIVPVEVSNHMDSILDDKSARPLIIDPYRVFSLEEAYKQIQYAKLAETHPEIKCPHCYKNFLYTEDKKKAIDINHLAEDGIAGCYVLTPAGAVNLRALLRFILGLEYSDDCIYASKTHIIRDLGDVKIALPFEKMSITDERVIGCIGRWGDVYYDDRKNGIFVTPEMASKLVAAFHKNPLQCDSEEERRNLRVAVSRFIKCVEEVGGGTNGAKKD